MTHDHVRKFDDPIMDNLWELEYFKALMILSWILRNAKPIVMEVEWLLPVTVNATVININRTFNDMAVIICQNAGA